MIVLSHFRRPGPASVANHRRYASLHGYRHVFVDATAMPDQLQWRLLYKYETLLDTLAQCEPDELVLLLSEDAAIVDPLPLDRLMSGRDRLLVCTSSHDLPQVDVQVWRNTPAVREAVRGILKRCRLGGESVQAEAELFTGVETLRYTTLLDGACPVMQAGYNFDPQWSQHRTFAISIDDVPHDPRRKGVTARYRDVLVDHINRRQAGGLPLFSFPGHLPAEAAERSTYNPGRPVALVTLYTPNIGVYGRMAERSLRRYCETHGHTLYVHRAIPAEIGLAASGNWFKPWLLHAYLQHHEWVVWVDADVLIADQQRKLEPMLTGRDALLAHDVGQWEFNSGVMGFRRTARNDALLRDMMAEIGALDDVSSVYASDGDQLYFIRALKRAGALDEDKILEFTELNTPWMFRRPDSFMVHYYGMWTEMRAMMMAHDSELYGSGSGTL